ncbi:hypothetical protein CEB94_27600 [Streptomyces hawaiiensis]|uniref:Uncharacterized protein n=1 Tax=Streptomyces hawaiiensis TaxID=67305 RepID=A0A6G5RJH4_9ACTN|nr:hypothetical protein [Streptomyces hawaiiensis]QCD58190.1 hypothetical protein CEB94_27600 [Streptomyces hawaiiensis]
MGSEEAVCPGCGQSVETVVRRHKTLGAWVPRWVAGPCRNPECGDRDAEDADSGHTVEGTRRGQASAAPGKAAPPATPKPDPARGESAAKNS